MPNSPGRQVLIIEDNFFMAQVLSEKLARLGLSVAHVQDGNAAISEFTKRKPDMVVLDLPLAGALDGFATMGQIRALSPDVPLLALFNTSDAEELEHAKQAGVTSWLIKSDVNSSDIVATIA